MQNAPQPTLFLTEYQDGWHNQKLMKNTPVLHFISIFKGSSYINLVIQLPFFKIFCCFTTDFICADMIFYKFLKTLFGLIWKNIFVTNFTLIGDLLYPPPPHPPPLPRPSFTAFNRQNPLSIKVFCWCSLMGETNFLPALMAPE